MSKFVLDNTPAGLLKSLCNVNIMLEPSASLVPIPRWVISALETRGATILPFVNGPIKGQKDFWFLHSASFDPSHPKYAKLTCYRAARTLLSDDVFDAVDLADLQSILFAALRRPPPLFHPVPDAFMAAMVGCGTETDDCRTWRKKLWQASEYLRTFEWAHDGGKFSKETKEAMADRIAWDMAVAAAASGEDIPMDGSTAIIPTPIARPAVDPAHIARLRADAATLREYGTLQPIPPPPIPIPPPVAAAPLPMAPPTINRAIGGMARAAQYIATKSARMTGLASAAVNSIVPLAPAPIPTPASVQVATPTPAPAAPLGVIRPVAYNPFPLIYIPTARLYDQRTPVAHIPCLAGMHPTHYWNGSELVKHVPSLLVHASVIERPVQPNPFPIIGYPISRLYNPWTPVQPIPCYSGMLYTHYWVQPCAEYPHGKLALMIDHPAAAAFTASSQRRVTFAPLPTIEITAPPAPAQTSISLPNLDSAPASATGSKRGIDSVKGHIAETTAEKEEDAVNNLLGLDLAVVTAGPSNFQAHPRFASEKPAAYRPLTSYKPNPNSAGAKRREGQKTPAQREMKYRIELANSYRPRQ